MHLFSPSDNCPTTRVNYQWFPRSPFSFLPSACPTMRPTELNHRDVHFPNKTMDRKKTPHFPRPIKMALDSWYIRMKMCCAHLDAGLCAQSHADAIPSTSDLHFIPWCHNLALQQPSNVPSSSGPQSCSSVTYEGFLFLVSFAAHATDMS